MKFENGIYKHRNPLSTLQRARIYNVFTIVYLVQNLKQSFVKKLYVGKTIHIEIK